MSSSSLKIILTLFLYAILPTISIAASLQKFPKKINHQLPHIATTIEVDGNMTESVWQDALIIELNYETSPRENTTPPVKTIVYLYENGETLYIAFDAQDNNPESIRDFLLERDNIWGSDFVGIKFDTFGESRKAFQFFTNARGIQADAIQEDFRGDDSTWDAIWESKTTITEQGYIVEMAIPFQALRFPATGKEQSWAIEVLRFYPRSEFHRIANSPVNRNISCQICQFDQLTGFSKVKHSQNLRLVPTLVVGQSESREEDPLGHWQSNGIDTSPGLDIRWGITKETYLNATINPDFSQVEADTAQLDINNTFSIFVDEKRPFFLDGSDYFTSMNRLVHTKDIIEPDYGLKITGQSNGHSYGAIVINDNHTSLLLPTSQSSNLVVLEDRESQNQMLRYQHDFGNKNTLGFLATHKTAGEYNNQVSAIDGKYWINQEHSIRYQLMHSNNHYSDEMIQSELFLDDTTGAPLITEQNISDTAYSIKYNYDTRSWRAKAGVVEFGQDFRADLGFIRRVDFKKKDIGLTRIWYSDEEESWWNKISFGGDWDQTDNNKGVRLEQEIEGRLRIEGTYQSNFGFGFVNRERLWEHIYFDETQRFIFSSFEPLAGLKLRLNINKGNSIDFTNSQIGETLRISPKINWQVNQHILSSLDYSKLTFDVSNDELFNAAIVNFRISYLFDERSSLRFTLQQINIQKNPELYDSFFNADLEDDENQTDKSLATQLLYTYRVNPQTLFFAGYSDEGFQDDSLNRVNKITRSLFLKFSYAWQA